jgi:hypothetical protein
MKTTLRVAILARASLFAIALLVFGCAKSEDRKVASKVAQNEAPTVAGNTTPSGKEGRKRYKAKEESKKADKAFGRLSSAGGGVKRLSRRAPAKPAADAPAEGEGQKRVQTRAWFPETFLFKPIIVTDAQGRASVDVRVPDRLTTWRVLALAHGRNGAQAGAVASFLGTLPAYVQPIIPPFLRTGDVVKLPVNVVNTTDKEIKTTLVVQATDARVEGPSTQTGGMALTVPAKGSVVQYVTLRATTPGQLRLFARLGGKDSVTRTVKVFPPGRAVEKTFNGTLGSPRTIKIERAAGADPELGEISVTVFAGALAILRSELASSGGRGHDLADAAFSLLLSGKAPALFKALVAAEPSKKQKEAQRQMLRDLTNIATQRILRWARVLDVAKASLIAEAARAHQQNPLIGRLADRARETIERKQSPDGTCGGQSGWSLQRLLVATADCAAASDSRRVRARASVAFQRHAKRIKDPYTAAAILASGAVADSMRKRLTQMVKKALEARPDGSKAFVVGRGVVRADGRRPSSVEATALAVLALGKADKLADLGETILAGYTPGAGWGDGRANLVCMKAAMKLFGGSAPKSVRVELKRDGKVVASGTLDSKKLQQMLSLYAKAKGAEKQVWTIAAEPAMAGLGYALTHTDRVPWTKSTKKGGVELSIAPPKALSVGKRAQLTVRAVAPAYRNFTITLRLPAGVQVDKKPLERLVSQGALRRFKVDDEKVVLRVKGLPSAKVFQANMTVVPTLAGTVKSGANTLLMPRYSLVSPPTAWTVTAAQ